MIRVELNLPNELVPSFARQMDVFHELSAQLLCAGGKLRAEFEDDLTKSLVVVADLRRQLRGHVTQMQAWEVETRAQALARGMPKGKHRPTRSA